MITVELRLADLMSDPAVKDLTKALVALARVEDQPTAAMAIVAAAAVVLHANLIYDFRQDPLIAERNRGTYLGVLDLLREEVRNQDLGRLSTLAEMPILPQPARVQ